MSAWRRRSAGKRATSVSITWFATISRVYVEPERRELGQDLALVGNAGAEHVVERGDAIGRHHEQRVAGIVDVAYLALPVRSEPVQSRFDKGSCEWHGRSGHLTGTMRCPQPYATVPVIVREGPDILCYPGASSVPDHRLSSGDCPFRVVPSSREPRRRVGAGAARARRVADRSVFLR